MTCPSLDLYMLAMTGAIQYNFTPDAVFLVLASHACDPDDYIRTYGDLVAGLAGHPAGRED